MNEETLIKYIGWIIYGSLVIFAITVLTYIFRGHFNLYNDINPTTIGTFGDFIGGFIGTLFTIVTTFLVWLTYNSQKIELEKTSSLAEKQYQTINQQQFESTFFNLVSELKKMPDSILGQVPKIDYNNVKESFELIWNTDSELIEETKKGHEFFIQASEALRLIYITNTNQNISDKNQNYSEVEKHYDFFYKKYLDELDHYFRSFYNILKLIDNSTVANKKFYSDILQAQLSKYELGLIFYNGLGEIGKVKLHPLLERYNFLENVNESSILKKHYSYYPYTKFRFLNSTEKNYVVLNALRYNPEKISNDLIKDYYIEKYNYEDKINALLDELDLLIVNGDAPDWALQLNRLLKNDY